MTGDLHQQLADTATEYAAAGFSVVPAKADGSKAPFGRWRDYQERHLDEHQLRTMLATGQYDGIGLIMGAVSGGAEMLEFEGRAVEAGLVEQLRAQIDPHLWKRLLDGHLELTPSGGLHLLYRVTGEDVPGNLKLARRPGPVEHTVDVLLETRGEGGFTVCAPSAGRTHPTGKPWQRLAGTAQTVPTITAAERAQLHTAARALDAMPQEQPWTSSATPTTASATRPTIAGTTTTRQVMSAATAADAGLSTRPGDDYNVRADWREILEPHGWTRVHPEGRGWAWTRPGKNPRDGISATTGQADDADRLYVFTTSTIFESLKPYSKLAAYALLNHGGDMSAAARELRRLGYGDDRSSAFAPLTIGAQPCTTTSQTPPTPSADGPTTTPPASTSSTSTPQQPPPSSTTSSAASAPAPPTTAASTSTTATTPAPSSSQTSTPAPDAASPVTANASPTLASSAPTASTTPATGPETAPAPADAPPADLEAPERTSWWPRDLTGAIAGTDDEPPPTHLARQDGHRLLYAGKVNGLIGESESGKSWVALYAVLQALQIGEPCLYLDFEDTAPGIVSRLRALGATDAHLARLAYVGPDEALHAAANADLSEAITEHSPTVVVLDGVNAAMTLLGLELESNGDATKFSQLLLKPISRTGATVITVDHVPKNADARGKGGIGAQAKRAMMTGCALRVEVLTEFGRGMTGRLKLTVDKDRPGHVRANAHDAKNAGTFVLESHADGTARAFIEAPDMRSNREVENERETIEESKRMQVLSEYLESVRDDPTMRTTAKVVGAVTGEDRVLVKALERLEGERYATHEPGPRGAKVWTSTRPYRRVQAVGSVFGSTL